MPLPNHVLDVVVGIEQCVAEKLRDTERMLERLTHEDQLLIDTRRHAYRRGVYQGRAMALIEVRSVVGQYRKADYMGDEGVFAISNAISLGIAGLLFDTKPIVGGGSSSEQTGIRNGIFEVAGDVSAIAGSSLRTKQFVSDPALTEEHPVDPLVTMGVFVASMDKIMNRKKNELAHLPRT